MRKKKEKGGGLKKPKNERKSGKKEKTEAGQRAGRRGGDCSGHRLEF